MTTTLVPAIIAGGSVRLKAGLLLSTCVVFMPAAAHAQDAFLVQQGSTATSTFQVNENDTLTVEEGGTLSVTNNRAINYNGEPTGDGPVIDNAGTIEAMINSNGRALDAQPTINTASRNIIITNRATGIMRGAADGIRISQEVDVTAPSLITIDNAGHILAVTGAGIEVSGIPSAGFNLTNRAGGTIEGGRRGVNAIVGHIDNAGTITGTLDAIRFTGLGDSSVILRSGSTTQGNASDPTSGAVTFAGTGTHTLTVETGAITAGRFKGSATSADDILVLRGSGAQATPDIVDFDVLRVEGGTWDFGNAVSLTSGATISSGATLRLTDGAGTSGSLHGAIVNNGELVFARTGELNQDGLASDGITPLNSPISGSGAVRLTNADGVVIFSQKNAYTGATLIDAGTLRAGGADNLAAASAVTIAAGAILDFDGFDNSIGNLSGAGQVLTGSDIGATLTVSGSTNGEFSGIISGLGGLTKSGGGRLTLSGANDATGLFHVKGGTLLLGGSLAGSALADGTGTLSGNGTVAGTTTIAAGGTLAPGMNGVGTFTTGGLILEDGARLAFDLGAPGDLAASDRIQVNGDLTLGGTVDVANAGGFGDGVYRLIDYTGTLTDNGLIAGVMPLGFASADAEVQTSIDKQVNLVISAGSAGIKFWDGGNLSSNGTVDGGSGSWTGSATNWTNVSGSMNTDWDTQFAVFQGGAGTVSVDDAIAFTGMQFVTDGYVIAAGSGSLTADSAETNIRVDPEATATIAAAIGGSGGIVKLDTGTLILSGDNGYSGSTAVNGGTLALTGSLAGSAIVADKAVLTGGGTVDGVTTIRDGGTLAPGMNGVGTFTTGGLVLESGASLAFDLGAPGDLTASDRIQVNGDLTLDGTIDVANAGGFGQGVYRLIDYTGSLTDHGLMVGQMPVGFLAEDAEVQTAIGNQVNLVISSAVGELQFWDGSDTAGNDAIDGGSGGWTSDATNWTDLDGRRNAAWGSKFAVFQGPAGTVTVDDEIAISGMQFMTDGYVIADGTGALAIEGAETAIRVDAGVTATIEETIGGTGGIAKLDSGTLILSGQNSYTGATLLNGGTLRAAATGALSGTSLVNIAAGANLDLTADQRIGGLAGQGKVTLSGSSLAAGGSNIDSVFGGVISGSGGFTKFGSGTLTLSGVNDYTGATLVEAGTLSVSGRLASSVTVAEGARLSGDGRIEGLTVNGTVAPGNSIGTLTVRGPVTFTTGSVLEIEVSPAEADRLTAQGAVTIDGGKVAVLAGTGSYAPLTSYTILSGTSVAGTFDDVTSNLAFLTPTLGYSSDAVTLTLTRNDKDFSGVTTTLNQFSVAEAVEALGAGNAIYNALIMQDDNGANAAFDSLSGEVHGTIQTALIDSSRIVRDAALERLVEVSANGGNEAGVAMWARGIAAGGTLKSDGNAAQAHRSSEAVMIGIDTAIADVRVGAVLGYGTGALDLDAYTSTAEAESWHMGLYAGGNLGRIRINAGAGYSTHKVDTNRRLAGWGLNQSLTSSYDAKSLQAFGEVGYRLLDGDIALEPFAGLSYVRLDRDSFVEEGGNAALGGMEGDADRLTSSLGINLSTNFSDRTRFDLQAAWQHGFGDLAPVSRVTFANGAPFDVRGVSLARNSALVKAGVSFRMSENARAGVSYAGQFSERGHDHSARVGTVVGF